jgi:hypothetical protein
VVPLPRLLINKLKVHNKNPFYTSSFRYRIKKPHYLREKYCLAAVTIAMEWENMLLHLNQVV